MTLALGCLEIPLAIANAFASIPGQLLTVRVQQTSDELKLLQNEKSLITAQQDLLNARLAAGK